MHFSAPLSVANGTAGEHVTQATTLDVPVSGK